MKLVQEKFLTLMQEARFHVDDFKGLAFGRVKAQGGEFPSIGKDVDADDQDPIAFGFCQPRIHLPDGHCNGFSSVFNPVFSPCIHAFLPVELSHRFKHV